MAAHGCPWQLSGDPVGAVDVDSAPVDALGSGDDSVLSLVLPSLVHLAEHPGGDLGALGDAQDGDSRG